MSISDIKKEIFWLVFLILLLGVFLTNTWIHSDYEDFRKYKKHLEGMIAYEKEYTDIKYNKIMPSCIIGQKTH